MSTPNNITVTELYDRKHKLKLHIEKLMKDFKEETGIYVLDITASNQFIRINSNHLDVMSSGINIEVNLNL